jgi:hypothetical protein
MLKPDHMNSFRLYDFYRHFIKDDLTLAYYGSFSDSITDKIIELSEDFLDKTNLGKFKNKVGFLVAECFQNVTRHGNLKDPGKLFSQSKNAFFIRIKNNICYVSSVNSVSNEIIPRLSQKIEHLNRLDKKSLDHLHKMVLEEGSLSEKGGAGLGLIEMARKTGQKLYYSFEPISNSHSYFYIMIFLGSFQESKKLHNDNLVFSEIKLLHSQLAKLDQYIVFKCDFSEGIVLPVINMIERNLEAMIDHYPTKWKIYHSTVEIMQNITHHGMLVKNKRTGVFSFGKNEEGYMLTSVNPVLPESKLKIKKHLGDLVENTREELNLKYRKQMNVELNENSLTAGLGFIDMTRICKMWDYDFKAYGKGKYLFNFQVII